MHVVASGIYSRRKYFDQWVTKGYLDENMIDEDAV